jgi:hypothetical protein
LCVLAGVAIVVSGLAQQVSPTEVAAARELWREKGPKSYDITYVTKTLGQPSQIVYVSVVDGVVVFASRNDVPLPDDKGKYYDVNALFNDIEGFLNARNNPDGGWTDIRALFDKDDGHPLWYSWSVIGRRKRIDFELKKFEPKTRSR